MPVRTAEARWQRSLQDGSGTMRLGSGAFEGSYSFKSRMEDGPGTNPEELIGAACGGCFFLGGGPRKTARGGRAPRVFSDWVATTPPPPPAPPIAPHCARPAAPLA